MYALFTAMALMALSTLWPRLGRFVEARIVAIGAASLTIAIAVTVFRNISIFEVKPLALSTVTAVTASVFIAALLLRTIRAPSIPLVSRAGISVVFFVIAVVCQIGDRPGGWLLNPDAIVQAHSLWHVFSALAVGLVVSCLDIPASRTQQTD